MTSLPRPPAPPSGPLPALPVAKTRKSSSPNVPDPGARRGSAASDTGVPTPRQPTRSVTTSGLPTPKPTQTRSTPAVPTLRSADASSSPTPPPSSVSPTGVAAPSIRKTSSIGAFPVPPKGTPRVSSLPPSPLSASTSLSDIHGTATAQTKRRDPAKHRNSESGLKKPKTRSSGYGVKSRSSLGATSALGSPSLTNGTGDSNAISSANGSDSLLSLPSPPGSRSSSAADGSYMTDGTACEDLGDEMPARGRPKSQETITDNQRHSGVHKDSKGNVLVSVRVRPDAGGSESKGSDGEWMVDGRRSLISYNGKEGGDYKYDNVFSPNDHNSRVYDSSAKRLVRRVMEGYHGTVFAYGMTGTGKTFSMQGTANSPGVIPLAITDIFSYIRENPDREFLLRVSYLEIYNERIYDLLSQGTPSQVQQEEIKLREDSKRGVYATPLKEEIVQSPNQLLRVIARGDLARRTGSTQFNARSSRSHAVVQIVVESRERGNSNGAYPEKETRRANRIMPGGVLVSTLSLIDLAGSERAADNKERRTEGAHINKSLLTLGTVIGKLAGEDEKDKGDGGKPGADKEKTLKHLPYRDSKLTRLLQPALSGNSLVSILCTIQLSATGSAASAHSHTGETLNTLKFASRAKNNIVSHAKRNESNPNSGDPGSRALLERYRIEIQELRTQLDQQNHAKAEAEKQEEIEKDRQLEAELERQEQSRHEEQMLEMQLARTALKERISHLNRLILSSKSLGVNSGRYSSASMPLGRTSMHSVNEFGRPVSVRSGRESYSSSRRESAATLEVPPPVEGGSRLSVSGGLITTGILPAAQTSLMVSEESPVLEEDEEDGNDGGVDGEGNATLAQQNRMLQADLADKNRYIATLEKRLLQARRTSHSRVSLRFASQLAGQDANHVDGVVREKDKEIEELRAKLDDQMRMVTALRSAARKREMIDGGKSQTSEDTARPVTSSGASTHAGGTSRSSTSSLRQTASSHRSNPSTTSRSSAGVVNLSKTPLSPIGILSPTHSDPSEHRDAERTTFPKSQARRRSVDEMTMLLDQMIQEKVESGQVVHSDRGSLRVKRDTVMERAALADVTFAPPLEEDETTVHGAAPQEPGRS
ncbi:kinesin-like protein KIN-7K, chloroplastic [Teratosphaeria destructans]|uniref:Kinesin-like protein KIP2 n=1 Tax=Teratosphaeria destructans TaxID=418781 RepID=A0A9W7SZZ3_9PEZI|nr:kinesin-like protein KIN-7K, chloroplastic [Teratosphaeria destructans]